MQGIAVYRLLAADHGCCLQHCRQLQLQPTLHATTMHPNKKQETPGIGKSNVYIRYGLFCGVCVGKTMWNTVFASPLSLRAGLPALCLARLPALCLRNFSNELQHTLQEAG